MGKKKSSTPAERRLIWETFQKTKSVGKVSEVLGFSRGKVNNSIHYYKKNSTFNDLPRKKPRKTTKAEDRRLVRISKSDPFLTSTEIRAEMETHYGVQISAQTVRRCLNLNGRIARRKSNVSKKKNIKKRLQFAHEHWRKDSQFWKMIVWSDESKFNVFGNDGRPYVRRPPLKELDKKYTKKTVKHGGSSVVV